MEMRNESNSSVLHVFVFVAKKKHMKAKVCLRELKAGSQCLITEVHLARVIKSLKCLSVISTELLGVTFN